MTNRDLEALKDSDRCRREARRDHVASVAPVEAEKLPRFAFRWVNDFEAQVWSDEHTGEQSPVFQFTVEGLRAAEEWIAERVKGKVAA
jgi:hypothetical protein